MTMFVKKITKVNFNNICKVGDIHCGSDSGRSISSSITALSMPTVCADGVVVWHGSALQASLKSKGRIGLFILEIMLFFQIREYRM